MSRKARPFLLALLTVLPLANAVAAEPAGTATLELEIVHADGDPVYSGRVFAAAVGPDGRGRWPVASAERPSSPGLFVLGSAPAGKVRIEVRVPGHAPFQRDLRVVTDPHRERIVLGPPATGEVELQFVDTEGRPVPGVTAFLDLPQTLAGAFYPRSGGQVEPGGIRWARVPVGTYTVHHTLPGGYATVEPELPVVEVTPEGRKLDVVFRRIDGRPVTGRVIRAGTGEGIAGARLSVRAQGATFEAEADERGLFAFERLPPGEHEVRFLGVGVMPAQRTARVPEDDQIWIFELPSGVELTGRLQLAPGVAATGPWRVDVVGRDVVAMGRVHDDLTFRLYEKLAPGTWCLEVISRGGEAAGWKMLELPENAGEVQVDLEIRPGRRRCPR